MILIHPLTWTLAGVSFLTGQFMSFFLLMLIIIIHECGHIAAALLFKWEIQSVTLLPFGGKLVIKGILDRPLKEELLVVLCGPLQHVVIGAAAFFFLKDWSYYSLLMQLNLQLLCFNLLPLWPLDGGRILFLSLARINSFSQAMKQTLQITMGGLGVTVVITSYLFPFNLQWILVLVYVATACVMQWKHRSILERQFWLERCKNRGNSFQPPHINYVPVHVTINQLLHDLKKGKREVFIVKNRTATMGMITDVSIINQYFKRGTGSEPVSFLLEK